MDGLLKKLLCASGVSGYEDEVGGIIAGELKKSCDEVNIDGLGSVIARKGKGGKKIMLAAHMDEIGLVVKSVNKDGYVSFIKVGGIDDRILVGQKVLIKAKAGDVMGIVGSKPPHLQKEEERKQTVRHEEMFIDIGYATKDEALKKIAIGDAVIFEPSAGVLNKKIYYGKAVDDRVGCYILIKAMERIKKTVAEIYAVATTQEEVGLKGARTASFRIAPDFAIALDTNIAGDTPQIKETESALKLGAGVGITIIEASGRGIIVNSKIKDMIVDTAKKNKIKYQIGILEGGMTDGAIIYMNREGIPTGVLSIPTRYVHAPSGVFNIDDVNSAIELAVKVIERVSLSDSRYHPLRSRS